MNPIPPRLAGKGGTGTGAASGIGEAIARRLVAEGAQVVAADINAAGVEALAAELGDAVRPLHVDVREEDEIEAMVALAVEAFGGLDAGFNVAGAAGGGPIDSQELESWRFTFAVCLDGVMLCMKHQARRMKAQGRGGTILNISSLNSVVPMFGASSYCTAKAGVAMLTQCGALELADHGIRVNCVSPGLTETAMSGQILGIPGVREAYMERIPAKRAAQPEDIAATALYLCTDDAQYVSGVNTIVDGAWATTGYPDLRPFLAQLMQPAGDA